jgi:hypothetical protein
LTENPTRLPSYMAVYYVILISKSCGPIKMFDVFAEAVSNTVRPNELVVIPSMLSLRTGTWWHIMRVVSAKMSPTGQVNSES